MAKKNTQSHVNSQGEVILSASYEKMIARITDPKSRKQLRADLEASVQEKHDAHQAYLKRRNVLEIGLTDRGFLFVNGTGTRRSAVFSKAQALAFCEEFAAFKKLANSMPDVGSSVEAEEDKE